MDWEQRLGSMDAAVVRRWEARAREWVRGNGNVVVKTGVDEAGEWWEVVTKGGDALWCLGPVKWGNGVCSRKAGWGTVHEGVGYCKTHEMLVDGIRAGGDGYRGRTGAWVMAHGFATAYECTPWEGLQRAVWIAAGRVAFIEAKLRTATDDVQLQPDGDLNWWVRQGEFWHGQLAKVSKMAIDAGVAERLVRQVELEGERMVEAARATLLALGFTGLELENALGMMGRKLLELEAHENESGKVLEILGTEKRQK